VVTNRNSIPADPNGAWYTSGIRLGTPALTTLGFGAAEMGEVADIIATTLGATTAATAPSGPSKARYLLEGSVADTGRRRSADLLARFPLYPELTL
jgi:glycine hydroxymethyltransferase